MGIFWSNEINVDLVIEDIESSDEFKEWKTKYSQLTPSRSLYIYDQELVVETQNPYSANLITFNWKAKNATTIFYDYIDKMYQKYNGLESETKQDKEILEFLNESVNSEIMDWNSWLVSYFLIDSNGYKIFKMMEKEYPQEIGKLNQIKLSPQSIWYGLLETSINKGDVKIRDVTSSKILKKYPFGNIKEIMDMENNSLAIINYYDGLWYYIGITKPCLDRVFDLYENQ
jgi:hypothetical protein